MIQHCRYVPLRESKFRAYAWCGSGKFDKTGVSKMMQNMEKASTIEDFQKIIATAQEMIKKLSKRRWKIGDVFRESDVSLLMVVRQKSYGSSVAFVSLGDCDIRCPEDSIEQLQKRWEVYNWPLVKLSLPS